MKKMLWALALMAVVAGVSAQASDPVAALKELNDMSIKARQDAQQSGKALDLAELNLSIKEKAVSLVKGVDVEKFPASEGYAWGQLFRRAGMLKEACRAAERYIATSPTDKYAAQMFMASNCFELKEDKALTTVLKEAQPGEGMEAYSYASNAIFFSDLIEEKSGPAAALLLIDDLEKKVNFGNAKALAQKDFDKAKAANRIPNGQTEEQYLASLEARMNQMQSALKFMFVERRADLLITANRKDDAIKIVTAHIDSLPENDSGRRTAKNSLTRMTMLNLAAPTLNQERGYGEFPGIQNLKGKVVIVDFFAHWCGPCIASFPDMKKLYSDYKDKGLEIVGVTTYYGYYKQERNLDKDTEFAKMKDFLGEHQLPWPVIYGDRTNFEAYGVSGIPHVAVVGKDGTVHKIKVGYSPASFAEFRAEIEKLLKD